MKVRAIFSMNTSARLLKLYARVANSYIVFYFRWLTFRISGRTSLNKMDREITKYLPHGPGFFVEAGGNDGVRQSNTFVLEKRFGWKGLIIEPVPRLATMCRKSRSNSMVRNIALVSPENVGKEITMIDLGLMTFVGKKSDEWFYDQIRDGVKHIGRSPKTFAINGDSLSNILLSIGNPQVDFFSLDVEGYEFDVLEGLDFSIHKPRLILVETKKPIQMSERLNDLYDLVAQLSHHDYLYRLKDRYID